MPGVTVLLVTIGTITADGFTAVTAVDCIIVVARIHDVEDSSLRTIRHSPLRPVLQPGVGIHAAPPIIKCRFLPAQPTPAPRPVRVERRFEE
jgi:hypothetical protein